MAGCLASTPPMLSAFWIPSKSWTSSPLLSPFPNPNPFPQPQPQPRLVLGKAKGGATATVTATAIASASASATVTVTVTATATATVTVTATATPPATANASAPDTATTTYALQPNTPITITSSIGDGGGLFFSTSLLHSSPSADSSPLTNLFRSHGFREEDIDVILRKLPALHKIKVGNNLRPKLDILASTNLTGADISEILVANPHILRKSVGQVTSHINFLKTILPSKDDLIHVLKRSNFGTQIESNVEVLKNRGVAGTQIRNILISQPNALNGRKMKFLAAAGDVKGLNLSPDDGSIYLQALSGMSYTSRSTFLREVELFKKLGWSDDQAGKLIPKFASTMDLSEDTIRKKVEFFREKLGWSEEQVVNMTYNFPSVVNKLKKMELLREKLGWSEDQVVEVIRKQPTILGLSQDTIMKKVEFFKEKARWGADCLYKNPDLFSRSIEMRFIPRCAAINILVSRGFLKKKMIFSPRWTKYTDGIFYDKYIRRFEGQAPDVADALHGQVDFLGWDWLKDGDDNNQLHLHKNWNKLDS